MRMERSSSRRVRCGMRSFTCLAGAIASTLALVACGGGSGDDTADDTGDDTGDDTADVDAPAGAPDAPHADAAEGQITLTSTAFSEGDVIPVDNSCHGDDLSPELTWSGGPVAQSYAVVFTDISDDTPFIHSVIYDIDGSATGLPADVDKVYAPPDVPGAHQTLAYDGSTRGYRGPCPGKMHTYEFRVYALDEATLPGATMTTSRTQAVGLIQAHDLADGVLTGTFTPP